MYARRLLISCPDVFLCDAVLHSNYWIMQNRVPASFDPPHTEPSTASKILIWHKVPFVDPYYYLYYPVHSPPVMMRPLVLKLISFQLIPEIMSVTERPLLILSHTHTPQNYPKIKHIWGSYWHRRQSCKWRQHTLCCQLHDTTQLWDRALQILHHLRKLWKWASSRRCNIFSWWLGEHCMVFHETRK